MKKTFSAMLFLAALGCMNSAVFAAELLDVKPVVTGSTVSIDISADIPMTYTYYKVPGQARAVIDIAEADPEKVEPLIVVNKGAVSSISVDKAQISGIVVSRIIFNLISELDIFVAAAPDRKLLSVTFGASTASAGKTEPKKESSPEPLPEPETPPKPAAKAEEVAVTVNPPAAAQPVALSKEEDPLGLDEPVSKSPSSTAKAPAEAGAVKLPTAPTVMRVPKLEPVVPVAAAAPARPMSLMVKEILTGASYIEIRTNQPVADFKTIRLVAPERLVIDIPAEKTNQKPKTVFINKFGITKARIGVSPNNIRVVIDTSKSGFPAHTITSTADRVRITFK